MDEIKLFDELKPPPLSDVPRMHEAVRSRLAAATSAPPATPARRRRTMVAVATGAAMVAAGGTGYGLTAAHGDPSPRPGPAAQGSGAGARGSGVGASHATVAGLTAVHGCPGMYLTAGTLERVTGTQLTIQPPNRRGPMNGRVHPLWRAKPVTVATSSSTAITRPASGTVSDITDGSHVFVQGAWSGGTLAATEVGIEQALPTPRALPKPHGHVRTTPTPKGWLGPPFANGTVTDVHGGSFTVVTHYPLPIPGSRARIPVTTSSSTTVVTKTSASPSQLRPGANLVAVGRMGSHGVLTASLVTEPSGAGTLVAGGLVKVRPSGCSASAVTDAVLQVGG